MKPWDLVFTLFYRGNVDYSFVAFIPDFSQKSGAGHNGGQDMLVWSDLTKVGLPSRVRLYHESSSL